MPEIFQQAWYYVQQLFSGRSAVGVVFLALVLTVILRFVVVKLFKLALHIVVFVLIYVCVLVGLGYLLSKGFSGAPF
jgi:hypothetical protein